MNIPTAKKLDALIRAQLHAYEKLMNEHCLSQEKQDRLLKLEGLAGTACPGG